MPPMSHSKPSRSEYWDIIFFGHTDFSNEARNGPDPTTHNFYIYKSVEPQAVSA
ncbi:hypothetical protein PGTUg99_012226 [Puccinia graminis f. sp. tritici]|uniref:Uncharacterized protein n=1 Tax=Puccinia graminis f. sp. tritici TaxID=56615 RepID=A0A5B0SFF2_PUCGR|nr:hypothetical protein PGTUg99_012226 [Puccinia graminis f. sp. tritici]